MAFYKGGYANSYEEAKASKYYTQPLKSKTIQRYLTEKRIGHKFISKELKLFEQETIKKEYKSYKDNSFLGINGKQFLIDLIENPKVHPRDRIEAFKTLLKFLGVDKNTEVPIIINNLKNNINLVKDESINE